MGCMGFDLMCVFVMVGQFCRVDIFNFCKVRHFDKISCKLHWIDPQVSNLYLFLWCLLCYLCGIDLGSLVVDECFHGYSGGGPLRVI